MSRALVDTSILVQRWRERKSVPMSVENRSKAISTVTYIELLQGANRRQKAETLVFLKEFEHVRLDREISDRAIELIDYHSETDGLRLADALIAATCLTQNLPLLTLNRRHFECIDGLELI